MIFRRLSRIKTRSLLLGILPAAIMALTLTVYIINAQLANLNQSFFRSAARLLQIIRHH